MDGQGVDAGGGQRVAHWVAGLLLLLSLLLLDLRGKARREEKGERGRRRMRGRRRRSV